MMVEVRCKALIKHAWWQNGTIKDDQKHWSGWYQTSEASQQIDLTKFEETVNKKEEWYGSMLLFGLDEGHIQSKEHETTKEGNMVEELTEDMADGIWN